MTVSRVRIPTLAQDQRANIICGKIEAPLALGQLRRQGREDVEGGANLDDGDHDGRHDRAGQSFERNSLGRSLELQLEGLDIFHFAPGPNMIKLFRISYREATGGASLMRG